MTNGITIHERIVYLPQNHACFRRVGIVWIENRNIGEYPISEATGITFAGDSSLSGAATEKAERNQQPDREPSLALQSVFTFSSGIIDVTLAGAHAGGHCNAGAVSAADVSCTDSPCHFTIGR